jgi:hypothetical protein
MPGVSKGEIWLVDFGLVAKVRPALLLTGDLSVPASGTPQSRGARKLASAQ